MTLTIDHNIGPLAQIPAGEGRNFRIGRLTVAVFRTQAGEVFATQPNCPHRAGPLADGLIGGTTLICPLHDYAFDLRTGANIGGTCPISVYPARLSIDQSIILALPSG
jgi:nitrite reductase (NADH) small subunit